LNEALEAQKSYFMEDPLENLVCVSWPHTSASPRLIWRSFSLKENAEHGIRFMGMNLHDHRYEFYSNQHFKLHVQLPWDPGGIHISTLCSRFRSVAQGRPWDPGIVAHPWVSVLDDLNVKVGGTMCDLTKPLLGGKQCFFGAVMSCPHMDVYLPRWIWA
jgi:hypothetical protein